MGECIPSDHVINIQHRFIWIRSDALRCWWVGPDDVLNCLCVASSARCPLINLLSRKSVEVIQTLAAWLAVFRRSANRKSISVFVHSAWTHLMAITAGWVNLIIRAKWMHLLRVRSVHKVNAIELTWRGAVPIDRSIDCCWFLVDAHAIVSGNELSSRIKSLNKWNQYYYFIFTDANVVGQWNKNKRCIVCGMLSVCRLSHRLWENVLWRRWVAAPPSSADANRRKS